MTSNSLNRTTNLIVAGAALGAALLMAVPRPLAMDLTSEDGPIESLSAGILALGVIFAVVRLFRHPSWLWLSIFIVVQWMYLRELDYQKMFTPRSVESVGFFSNPKNPLKMKLIAAAIMAPFALGGLSLFVAAVKRLRSKGQPRPDWLRPVAIALALLVVALGSEKLFPSPGKLVEEPFELAFGTLVVVMVFRYAFSAPNGAVGRAPTDSGLGLNESPQNGQNDEKAKSLKGRREE